MIEVLVVVMILGILTAMSMPMFQRALEQSRADIAGANLRAIWSAQRLYWLEHHRYASNLADLAPLLDPTIVNGTSHYAYSIPSADGNNFTATAEHHSGTQWGGTFTIDQTGLVTGQLKAAGARDIVPGFQ